MARPFYVRFWDGGVLGSKYVGRLVSIDQDGYCTVIKDNGWDTLIRPEDILSGNWTADAIRQRLKGE